MAFRRSMILLSALLLGAAGAGAQPSDVTVWRPAPGQNAPMFIDADELAVNDAQKVATFSGNVRFRQGDVNLRCSRARVWYHAAAPGGRSTVDRVECRP